MKTEEASGSSTASEEMATGSRPKVTFSDQKDDCGKCDKRVQDHNQGLQCDWCDIWYHAKCQGVDAALYKKVMDVSGAMSAAGTSNLWLCRACTITYKKHRTETAELKKNVQELEKKYQALLEAGKEESSARTTPSSSATKRSA